MRKRPPNINANEKYYTACHTDTKKKNFPSFFLIYKEERLKTIKKDFILIAVPCPSRGADLSSACGNNLLLHKVH